MIEQTGKAYQQLLTELTNALTDRTHTAASNSVALRDAVCEYVSVEHTRGTPLTDVIQTVKEVLRKAEAGATQASDVLAKQLIDWCREFHPGAAVLRPATEPIS